MRSPILAASAALLAVPALTLGMSVRPAVAAAAPKITSVTFTPRQIAANGAPAQVVAVINANGNTLSSVTATTNLKQTITLTTTGNGQYTGTVNIPANTAKKSRSVKVTVKVTYGKKSVSKASANSTQLGGGTTGSGGNNSTPPPPPPI